MDENSQVAQWLWDILNCFLDSEKVLFLRFVCGRSRLPSNLSDFSQHFQVSNFQLVKCNNPAFCYCSYKM